MSSVFCVIIQKFYWALMEMSCIKLKLVSYYKLFTISETLNCHDVIVLCIIIVYRVER